MSFIVNVFNEIELRVFCWHPGSSQIALNVMHLQLRASPGSVPITSQAAADSLSTYLSPLYRNLLDSSASYAGVSVQDFAARFYVPSWSKVAAGVGAIIGDDAPTQVSSLISWRTNRAGPKGRGRTYVGFVSTTSIDAAGRPTVAYMNDLVLLRNALVGEFIVPSGGLDFVWSLEVIDNKGLGDRYLVTSGVPRTMFATQRRRGDFGRTNALPAELA